MIGLKSLQAEVADHASNVERHRAKFIGHVHSAKQNIHDKATSPLALVVCAATGALVGRLAAIKTKPDQSVSARRHSQSTTDAGEAAHEHQGNEAVSSPSNSDVNDATQPNPEHQCESVASLFVDRLMKQSADAMIKLLTDKAAQAATEAVLSKEQNRHDGQQED